MKLDTTIGHWLGSVRIGSYPLSVWLTSVQKTRDKCQNYSAKGAIDTHLSTQFPGVSIGGWVSCRENICMGEGFLLSCALPLPPWVGWFRYLERKKTRGKWIWLLKKICKSSICKRSNLSFIVDTLFHNGTMCQQVFLCRSSPSPLWWVKRCRWTPLSQWRSNRERKLRSVKAFFFLCCLSGNALASGVK